MPTTWILGILFYLTFSLQFVVGGIIDRPVGCTVFPGIHLGLCSGRGICVLKNNGSNQIIITEPNMPNSQCICNPGWTGINDFVNMDTHDCGQNVITLRIIWLFILLSTLGAFIFIGYKLYQVYQAWNETENNNNHNNNHHHNTTHSTHTEKNDHSENEEYSRSHTLLSSSSPTSMNQIPWKIILSWPVVSSSLTAFLSSLFLFLLSIYRLIEPRNAIGVSIVSSFLYCMAEAFFGFAERAISFSWLRVRGKLARFTEKDEEVAQKAISRLQRTMYFAFVLDFLRILSISLIHVHPEKNNEYTIFYSLCIAVNAIISAIACIQAGRALESILMNGLDMLTGEAKSERESTLINIRKIIAAQKQALTAPLLVALMIGFWPFLRSHFSYALFQLIFTSLLLSIHLIGMQPPKTLIYALKNKDATPLSSPTTSINRQPTLDHTTPGRSKRALTSHQQSHIELIEKKEIREERGEEGAEKLEEIISIDSNKQSEIIGVDLESPSGRALTEIAEPPSPAGQDSIDVSASLRTIFNPFSINPQTTISDNSTT